MILLTQTFLEQKKTGSFCLNSSFLPDRVNCPFWNKIGACRHGERCSRIHQKPPNSRTTLIKNMYQNPATQMSIVDGQSLGTFPFEEFLIKCKNTTKKKHWNTSRSSMQIFSGNSPNLEKSMN
jgi:hypothetical protein